MAQDRIRLLETLVLKGPNYWKPEPKIKALLESRGLRDTPAPRGLPE